MSPIFYKHILGTVLYGMSDVYCPVSNNNSKIVVVAIIIIITTTMHKNIAQNTILFLHYSTVQYVTYSTKLSTGYSFIVVTKALLHSKVSWRQERPVPDIGEPVVVSRLSVRSESSSWDITLCIVCSDLQ